VVKLAKVGSAPSAPTSHTDAKHSDGPNEKTANKDTASGYAGLTAASKLLLAQVQQVLGHADLTDAPASAHHAKYTDAEAIAAVEAEDPLNLAGDAFIANARGLVIGHAIPIIAGNASKLQVLGTGGADTTMLVGRWSADPSTAKIDFVKSRSSTIGLHAIVQDNDIIGALRFFADDGVDFATEVARFQAEVDDASPAAGDIGMALVWKQMPGGGGASRETMRVNAAGDLSLLGQVLGIEHAIAVGKAGVVAAAADTADFIQVAPFDMKLTRLKTTCTKKPTSDATIQVRRSTDGGATFTNAFGTIVVTAAGTAKIFTSDPADLNINEGDGLQFSVTGGADGEDYMVQVIGETR